MVRAQSTSRTTLHGPYPPLVPRFPESAYEARTQSTDRTSQDGPYHPVVPSSSEHSNLKPRITDRDTDRTGLYGPYQRAVTPGSFSFK